LTRSEAGFGIGGRTLAKPGSDILAGVRLGVLLISKIRKAFSMRVIGHDVKDAFPPDRVRGWLLFWLFDVSHAYSANWLSLSPKLHLVLLPALAAYFLNS